MRRAEKQKGNTLALVVVCIGVIAVLVAFFALNYGQFLGSHKRAQTAIDAAALQAARDIGRVVINDGRFGRVSLCDDVPPGGDLNARPVWGLNTLLATARLDMIVADELDNSTMLYLAKQDMANAQRAGKNLAATIMEAVGQPGAIDGGQSQGPAKDKEGRVITILANATQAYNDNARRLGTGEMVSGSMKITVGQLTGGTAETNTPCPMPERLAGVNNSNSMRNQAGQLVYRAYVPIDTRFGDSVNNPVILAAVADEPTLTDTSKFSTLGLTTNIPAVVKVEADERVTQLAPGEKGTREVKTIHVAACAQAGGPRGTQPTGVLAVVFPQGMPGSTGSNVDLGTVQTIANNSQLGPNATGSTRAPQGGWNARGQWNQIVGGAFPSGTRGGPNGTQTLAPFNGRSATGVDNGSTSLSFLIYDWLRSCGLRPNVANVVAALRLPLRNQQRPSEYSPPAMSNNSFFMAPAYAQDEPTDTVASGIFQQYSNESYDSPDAPDTRLMGSTANAGNTAEYGEQWRTFLNSKDPGEAIAASPDGAEIQRTAYNVATGAAVAVGGADLGVLTNLWNTLSGSQPTTGYHKEKGPFPFMQAAEAAGGSAPSVQQLAQDAFDAAKAVIDEADQIKGQRVAKQSELDGVNTRLAGMQNLDPNDTQGQADKAALEGQKGQLEGEVAALQQQENKLREAGTTVKDNAVYVGDTQVAIKANIGAITGAGVEPVTGGFKLFGDTLFIPVTVAPTADDIKNKTSISAGQVDPGRVNSSNDWLSKKGSDGKPTLIMCHRSANPQIGKLPDGGGPFLPALAQRSQPRAGTAFVYIIMGDAGRTGPLAGARGAVKRIVTFARQANYAFGGHNLMEGQFLFNNPNALRTSVPGNAAIRWSLNAADWNATGATYGADNKPAGYSANVNENGYNVNPLSWCHQEAYMGGAQPEGGNSPCYYPSAVWALCCPDPEVPQCSDGSTPPSRTVIRADGTVALEVDPCPPPPRRSH